MADRIELRHDRKALRCSVLLLLPFFTNHDKRNEVKVRLQRDEENRLLGGIAPLSPTRLC